MRLVNFLYSIIILAKVDVACLSFQDIALFGRGVNNNPEPRHNIILSNMYTHTPPKEDIGSMESAIAFQLNHQQNGEMNSWKLVGEVESI